MLNRKDAYFMKAKREGYVARSAYKLIELNRKYNLIKKDDVVLDLGSSPGSWVQVCLKLKVRRIVGVDLEQSKIDNENFEFINESIGSLKVKEMGKFDAVLSDVAPNTSGHMDAENSIDLTKDAFQIARKVLKPNGNFLAKVFQGTGFEELIRDVRKDFEFFKISKPKASRKESKEIYLVGKGFKNTKVYK